MHPSQDQLKIIMVPYIVLQESIITQNKVQQQPHRRLHWGDLIRDEQDLCGQGGNHNQKISGYLRKKAIKPKKA